MNSYCVLLLKGPLPLPAPAVEANIDIVCTDASEQGELLYLRANR